MRWLQIGKEHINVLLKGKDPIVQPDGKWPKAAITICSYDLCKRKQQELAACKPHPHTNHARCGNPSRAAEPAQRLAHSATAGSVGLLQWLSRFASQAGFK